MTIARACLPSGRKSPDWKLSKMPLARHPVPKGLISNVQAPVSLLETTGGSGRSMVRIGSGDGGCGMKSFATVSVMMHSRTEKALIKGVSTIAALFFENWFLGAMEYPGSCRCLRWVLIYFLPSLSGRPFFRHPHVTHDLDLIFTHNGPHLRLYDLQK